MGRAWGIALGLMLAACSGKDEGGACSDASACGGDVTGTWKIASSCLEMEPQMPGSMSCPGATGQMQDVKMNGGVTYGADKTYQSNITLTGKVIVTLPASCLMQQGTTVSCAQLQQSLQSSAADQGYESVSCTGSSGCTCTMQLAPQTDTTSGTYSTNGGTLTMTSSGGSPDDSDYCVAGGKLTLSPSDPGSPITGSIVMTKQ
jgi:hypothetical protein